MDFVIDSLYNTFSNSISEHEFNQKQILFVSNEPEDHLAYLKYFFNDTFWRILAQKTNQDILDKKLKFQLMK